MMFYLLYFYLIFKYFFILMLKKQNLERGIKKENAGLFLTVCSQSVTLSDLKSVKWGFRNKFINYGYL